MKGTFCQEDTCGAAASLATITVGHYNDTIKDWTLLYSFQCQYHVDH